jgi:hypothetical protein
MMWVLWEDEDGYTLANGRVDLEVLDRVFRRAEFRTTVCLKYLNGYDDAFFNCLQRIELVKELEIADGLELTAQEKQELNDLKAMIASLDPIKDKTIMLRFYGE